MMKHESDVEKRLLQKLAVLNSVPERDTQKAAEGRRVFLQQALHERYIVTTRGKPRHKDWIDEIQSIFSIPRKEHSPMISTISAILLAISLIVGGGGFTVAAAQNSLPDEPLYGLKLLSEDALMMVSTDPLSRSQLATDLTDRRASEIQTMIDKADIPSESVQSRYLNEIEQSIRYALNLPDQQAVLALYEIRTRLQTQQEMMQQTRSNSSAEGMMIMEQSQSMLRQYINLLDEKMTTPDRLRDQLQDQILLQDRDREQLKTDIPVTEETSIPPVTEEQSILPTDIPTQGQGNGMENCPNCTITPEKQAGNGAVTESTQSQGNGNGQNSGAEVQATSTPVNGNNLPQTQNQNNRPVQSDSGGQSDSGSSGSSNGKH